MNRGSDIQGKVLHGFTVRRYVGRLYVFVACIALLWPVCVCAQPRKVQNLPYADHKLLHLGFSIGTHVQDMKFVHSPGIFFGNKVVKFRETATQEYRTQDIKSNYIVVPIELKFSALRCNNFRPYLIGGVMGTADVSKKRNDLLKLNTFDGYLTIGLGCDFYLPYFKRNDLRDLADIKFTQSLKKATSNMVILSFYFE